VLDTPDIPLALRRSVIERDSAAIQTIQHQVFASSTPPRSRASSADSCWPPVTRGPAWLIDALMAWAFSSLNASPGARAFYDELRTKGIGHNDALRRLANRLVGICTDA
jgi:hypothetical protein